MQEIQDSDSVMGILGNLFMGVSTAKMLDFLLGYREFDYSETDIAKFSGVSARQVYRALPALLATGLIYKTRTSGRSKMYKLNTNAVQAQYLEKMTHSLAQVKDLQVQSTFDEKENEKLTVHNQ